MKLRLNCPECNEGIDYQDINIFKAMAKCRNCGTVFDFEKKDVNVVYPKEKVQLPDSMEAYYMISGFDLEISWRKSSSNFKFFLFFTIFWNGFISVFLVIALASGSYGFLLPMGFHIVVGVGLVYYLAAVLLNKTYIGVSQWSLTVEHKPLPMPFYRTKDIPSKSIEQVYVERYEASRTNGRPDYAFAVLVKQEGMEKPIKIMRGLKTMEQGRFIEQEIEKFLHIEDETMESEWL